MSVELSSFIEDKPFEKLEGTVCHTCYVNARIWSLESRKRNLFFKARVDLGADITCVPLRIAKKLFPLPIVSPYLMRLADGRVRRVLTYKVNVDVEGTVGMKSYRPERGLILIDSEVGLIGMDIIKKWYISLDGILSVFSVSIEV